MGRVGGAQLLSLGSGCEYVGVIIHELMHSIGKYIVILRESSFNMTKGDEDIEGGGGAPKIFRHPKGWL